MNIQEFIDQYEGKYVEVAGSANAKNQCVDLANAYIRDVLHLPIIEWTNAMDFNKKCGDKYSIIYNDLSNPSLVPVTGDIVVYRADDGIGHIGICVKDGTASTFGIFEQNWPVGSPCKINLQKRYILGKYTVYYWLRCKEAPINEETMNAEQEKILNFIGDRTEGQVREAFGALADIPNLKKEIEGLKSSLENLLNRINDLEAKLSEKDKTIADCQKEIKTANKLIENQKEEIATLTTTVETLTVDKNNYKKWYESALDRTVDKFSVKELILVIVKRLTKK